MPPISRRAQYLTLTAALLGWMFDGAEMGVFSLVGGAAMQDLMRDVNRSVADYSQLAMIVIVHEPWSVENGCLTPTMKIKRNHIEALIAPQVERWYADGHQVQWA